MGLPGNRDRLFVKPAGLAGNKVRILIVSQYFWPEYFQINDVAKLLVAKGIEVDVLTGKPNYPEGKYFRGYRGWGCQFERYEGADIFRVPLVARGNRGALKLILNYFSFIVTGCLFAPWLLRGRRYDAIFVYGVSPLLQAVPALLIGALKRTKVALWVQDLWPESLSATGYVNNSFVLKCVEQTVRFIYRRADMLLIQSEAFRANLGRLAPGKNAVYFPNSVDPIFSDDVEVQLPPLPLRADKFSVVFTGNVGEAQGVEVIVKAAELLRDYSDISFIICGKGSRWDWMAGQIQQHGLTNLHLAGRFPVDMMPTIMRKASALLVTLANQPIFAVTVPSKIQAYLAVGRPILACLNGEGARLVSSAGAGLSVAAGDAEALAEAVLRLYKMPLAERTQLGENGRRYFYENFKQDKLMDELIAHLRTLSNPVEAPE
jgi:glycosyltransferase involved in cell wall biosynthesis